VWAAQAARAAWNQARPLTVSPAEVMLVDLAFTTRDVAPPDRLTAWQELVSRVFIPLAITPLGAGSRPAHFEASVTGRDLGGVRVWWVTGSPMSAERGRRHISAAAVGDYLLAVHLTGAARASQDGREVDLGPGDFALLDSARPYSIAFYAQDRFAHLIYQIPRASLDARRQAGQAVALRVPAASAPGRLVFPYLRTLAAPGSGPAGQAPGEAFTDIALDLVAGALRAVAGHHDGPPPRGAARIRELQTYALAHLGDPGLSPRSAARASYISVRQLHRLFAREGLSFAAWVREQRLRRCRDDLADSRLHHLAISGVAERWGYRSQAHFTRAFSARFGVTPREFRRAPG
jgi:AraC-like DNA-binding protein